MKYYLIIFALLLSFILVPVVAADNGASVNLPDGTIVSLDGLSSIEKRTMIGYMDKIAKRQANKVSDGVMETVAQAASDPEKLDAWRKVITGTIKDICNDLNVTVNDFVKTPVGLGVAGLIFYKVAGKDLLTAVMDVILIIPFWCIVTILILVVRWMYLSPKVIYEEIYETENEKGKKVLNKRKPKHTTRYPWKSNDSRTVLSVVLIGVWVITTVVTVIIAF